MFKMTLSPHLSNDVLHLSKTGNTLTINGSSYDFSSMNDGDVIPSDAISDPNIIGAISKEDGVVNLTILMPYSDPDADESVTFPEPLLWEGDHSLILNEAKNEY